MAIIAHASIDETGKIKNGIAGDQTGKEVCKRSWYNKPWSCVIRFTDPEKRERIAWCMEKAAENDHIGYDQNQRNTLLTQARKFNYDVSKVVEDCETDCSALVSVACMYAGIPESFLTLHGNCATTRTLKSILMAVGGVEIYTSTIYTSKSDRLKRGDILLKEGSHVAVVVEADDPNPYKLTRTEIREGAFGESVKWLQWQLNKHGSNLKIDGVFGKQTKLSVLMFQKDHTDDSGKPLAVDGIVGPKTLAALNK